MFALFVSMFMFAISMGLSFAAGIYSSETLLIIANLYVVGGFTCLSVSKTL